MHAVKQSLADRAFTVVGFFPSGEGFSDTVLARLPEDAKIRVIAGLRYTDEGGDLEVSCVLDAAGMVVEGSLDSFCIMNELEAMDSLVAQLREALPGPATSDGTDVETIDKLNAYLELIELVLSDSPHALDGVSAGATGYAEEDLTLQFIDSMGTQHEINPAHALSALAEKSLQLGWNPAAAQIEELTFRAGSAVSLAIIHAICDY